MRYSDDVLLEYLIAKKKNTEMLYFKKSKRKTKHAKSRNCALFSFCISNKNSNSILNFRGEKSSHWLNELHITLSDLSPSGYHTAEYKL